MRETVVVSTARTPFAKFGGQLKNFPAVDLGAMVIQEVVRRAGIEGGQVDLVVMGQVLQGGCGQIPSRQATLKAGLPKEIPSETVNKVCASSLRAITMADQAIRAGDADIIIAGGMESMSNAPFFTRSLRWGNRMFNTELIDLMVHDGLWCAVYDKHMAVHGGKVALEYGFPREAQDEWAVRSQKLAAEAIAAGRLRDEIMPVTIKTKKETRIFDTDESPRPETTLETLAKLPPLFEKENTVTAGNAPGTNDGASAVVLMSREKAQELNLKPLASIVGHAMYSDDASLIATVPGIASNKLLQKVGMTAKDIDLWESNEAFAAVTLVTGKLIGWDPDRVNVNGGAIAYGHPIGATGARIFMTLIHEMRRRGLEHGIATICSGAAQGDAILVRCE
ncbi:MAG: acetyl-CoA C-acetyltransferase [Heliobacteriaceae bacterium]|nr:acetyl-CoA C-acetyltransferase [Heliobacteriaceae bacterium]